MKFTEIRQRNTKISDEKNAKNIFVTVMQETRRPEMSPQSYSKFLQATGKVIQIWKIKLLFPRISFPYFSILVKDNKENNGKNHAL